MSHNHEIEHDEHTGTELTPHEWDGLKELNTPLPRWWLGIFYLCILWSIGYMILMPAIPALPGMQGYTKGVLGASTRVAVTKEVASLQAARAVQSEKLVGAEISQIEKDPELLRFAMAQGDTLFGDNCEMCHGPNGQGAPGFPNLNDDIWIWGGSFDDIKQTITHGIRAEDDETRFGDMTAFGRDEILSTDEIEALVHYVRTISGQESGTNVEKGKALFEENCTACHGDDAKGTRELGAPNLTDADWLYGGDEATIRETITNGRGGLMPNWNERLSPSQIAALAVYVHSLGGGE